MLRAPSGPISSKPPPRTVAQHAATLAAASRSQVRGAVRQRSRKGPTDGCCFPATGVNDGVVVNRVQEHDERHQRGRRAVHRDSAVIGLQESTAPGAASAARAGVSRLVLLGDPPSFDEDDSDPHVCVMPCDAVAVPSLAATAACLSTWADGLLFGADGVAATVSQPHTGGCLPCCRHLPRSPRQFGFDQGLLPVPSCPASRQKVSRSRRPAVSGCPAARQNSGRIPSIRPRRPSIERVAQSVPTGCISPCDSRYLRIAESRSIWASAVTSNVYRARAGFQPAVWSPSLVEMAPDRPP